MMSESRKGKIQKIGLPPGTLIYTGEKKTEYVKITVMEYDQEELNEVELSSVEELFRFNDKSKVTWINIDGIHDPKLVEAIGDHFGIHPLVLEDIMNTGQRPKIEDYGNYVFIVLRMLSYDDQRNVIENEQVSLIVSSWFVISFQEKEGDVFDPIRKRIRTEGERRIRKRKADYLAYALIDVIVDGYFSILERLSELSESLEENLISKPGTIGLQLIKILKRNTIFLRKSIWPLRDALATLERRESSVFDGDTLLYVRDVYDHTIRLIDGIETLRELTTDMLSIYLSSFSNRLNEIMKVLTIISTIFIPLTFIAGIYGMNFEHMPELRLKLGYPITLIIMLCIALFMIGYFRRKHWI